ncbi:MAG: hypothetical protein KA059_04825 [Elusimicrobiales bacterium]|nr:hypothetical protein [Elusimicrobiales bacterium]NLH39731.1 hypothetical protein [Elusimicrobiota bacterium]
MERRKFRTDFLFPNIGFTEGIGSVLNIGGNYFEFNTSESDLEADTKALENDWGMVGNDIAESIEKFKQEYGK